MVMNMEYYKNYLFHHGVKGQKWGVRRYQNKDGSLKPAGKSRYQNEDGSLTSEGKKREQERNFKEAQKTQRRGYRSSYDRMEDYQKSSKIVQERSKELINLAEKAKQLSLDLEDFQSEEAETLAWKRATERAKKEIPGYSTMSERDRYKMDEYYVYDGDELKKAIKELNKNNPEYLSLKKEYKQTISSYKEECKRITNEIIGDYGDNKISGLGTDMNYRELVYYALSKPNTMWMFTYEEDMGRK